LSNPEWAQRYESLDECLRRRNSGPNKQGCPFISGLAPLGSWSWSPTATAIILTVKKRRFLGLQPGALGERKHFIHHGSKVRTLFVCCLRVELFE
jgi:hypothetical protein